MLIQTTRIYKEIANAIKSGYVTISEQGSSRSSKTYNTVIWLIIYCITHPNTSLSIVRATLPALKGSVLRDFKEILQRMGLYDVKSLNKTELIYNFYNGSFCEFFSTDSEQKLRGRKRNLLYINEANEISFLEYQQLKMRTTHYTILDYNPSFSEDHWLNDVNKEEKTYHFITTYKDNPFLEKIIIDEIESLQYKNQSLWRIYGLGLQAIVEGLIFTNVEIVDEIPEFVKKRYLGVDFGYTNDPTAIVEVALVDDVLYIDEICYRTHMLTNDIISELKPFKGYKIISESADPRLVQEIYRAGINIHPVVKGTGSIEAGINKMQQYKIKITKRSTNVKKEFNNYVYSQDKEGKWLNKPIDKFNHGIDATRYVILSEVLGKNIGIDLSNINKSSLGIF